MKRSPLSHVLVASLALCFVLAGCGDSGGPDPKTEQVRMDSAVKMRELFTKAGGDYSKLDATDKAEYEKLAGGADRAQQAWNEMKTGRPSSGASAPPSGQTR